MEAIVLAGNLAPPALRELGVERVYLLTTGGETLLARICRCLADGARCSTVWVLAPDEVALPGHPAVRRAAYTGDVIADLLRCAREHCHAEGLLLSSSDIPAATPAALAALAERAGQLAADAVYHIVARPVVEQAYPGTKRTYLKLRDGCYTGGNVFYARRDWLLDNGPLLAELFADRKHVPALARRFGLLFLLRVILGLADIPYLERHLGRVLNARFKAAVLPYPELAVDLDKPADLALFRPLLDLPA